jgi:hypothetical protein
MLDTSIIDEAERRGLTVEADLLRAAIRLLARGEEPQPAPKDGEAAPSKPIDLKILAELRHQVAALCRVLATQQRIERDELEGVTTLVSAIIDEYDTAGADLGGDS